MTTTRGGIGRIGKAMVYSAIACLVAGALYAIYIVLFGEFEDFEVKVLLTTLVISVASIGWLCCSSYHSQRREPIAAIGGALLMAAAAGLMINAIWAEEDGEAYWKLTLSLTIWAVAVSHLLMLVALRLRRGQWWVHALGAITVATLATVLTLLVLEVIDGSESVMKLIVVLCILVTLETLVIPILSRVAAPSKEQPELPAGAELPVQLTLTALADGTFEDAEGKRYRVEEVGEA
ncbi:MAG: hypothetical protein ACYTFO_00795 [Planctomycetota bacterium]|jgi:hypothetical protein